MRGCQSFLKVKNGSCTILSCLHAICYKFRKIKQINMNKHTVTRTHTHTVTHTHTQPHTHTHIHTHKNKHINPESEA